MSWIATGAVVVSIAGFLVWTRVAAWRDVAAERQLTEARLSQACLPLDDKWYSHKEEMFWDGESLNRWAYDPTKPATTMPLFDGAPYLACLGNADRGRFCRPGYRETYARQLVDYFAKLRRAFITPEKWKRTYEDDKGIVRPTTPLGMTSELKQALSELTRNGLIDAASFGPAGVPADIAPFIEKPERQFCAQAR